MILPQILHEIPFYSYYCTRVCVCVLLIVLLMFSVFCFLFSHFPSSSALMLLYAANNANNAANNANNAARCCFYAGAREGQ